MKIWIQISIYYLSIHELTGDHVALRLMQQLNRHSNMSHFTPKNSFFFRAKILGLERSGKCPQD